jgi:hypothetical protein
MTDCTLLSTLKIGSFTYDAGFYTAQPFGYREDETQLGLTAETVQVTALMTASEWQELLDCYDAWRTARLNDDIEDIKATIGSTVAVSMEANGVSWSDVPSYFLVAPAGTQAGLYVEATCQLGNAEQLVEIFNKQKEVENLSVDYFGTFNLWGTELKLRRPPESYQDMPSLQLSAGGKSYTTGPRIPTEVMNLEGDTDKSGWNSIYSQCKSNAENVPGSEWFPISPPTANATKRIVQGVRDDLYTVSISVGKPQT